MAEGLQNIPASRIPRDWDPAWFADYIRQVLKFADVRNSIEGPGIVIEGQPDTPATISSSDDIIQLLQQSYILATPSAFLPNERILEVESGVLTVDDGGPNEDFTIRVERNGISNRKLRESDALSIMGRDIDQAGDVSDIVSSAVDTILRRVAGSFGDILDWGKLTLDMAADKLWTYAKIQDATALSVLGRAANTDGVLNEIVADVDGQLLIRRGTAVQFDTLADGDIPAGIARDSEVIAAIAALNLDSGTYTPALTNVANLDASTAYQCQYMRVGSVVTVSGRVDVDPTAPGSVQLGIALPIASNIGATEDCAGAAAASGIAGLSAAILGDATNNRAQLQFIGVDLTNQPLYFSFTYQVLT